MRLALPERFAPRLKASPELELATYRDKADVAAAMRDAEVAWLSFMPRATLRDAVAAGNRVRWIFTLGAGVDSWPFDLIRERGIVLTNGAGLAATPIAEYAVMGMLAAAKGFPDLVRAQDRREWLERPPRLGELHGSRALIVGYGSIGRAIGERLRAFGVDVTGAGRRSAEGWRERLGEFEWVVLAAPLTPETRHLVGAAELAGMRSTAWLVNVSRGGLVDTEALIEALRDGTIGGAYLDVHDTEPLPAESPLWALPNTMITPHSSWASARLEERAVALFEDNLGRYLRGAQLRNEVDLELGY